MSNEPNDQKPLAPVALRIPSHGGRWVLRQLVVGPRGERTWITRAERPAGGGFYEDMLPEGQYRIIMEDEAITEVKNFRVDHNGGITEYPTVKGQGDEW